MTSFSRVLLDQGSDLDLPIDLRGIIDLLDKEVPKFNCNGYGFQLTSTRALARTQWQLLVKLIKPETRQVIQAPVGRIIIDKLDNGEVHFNIPPRLELDCPGSGEFDPDGEYFGGFIYRILNLFQEKRLIELPGVLPVL